jgi:hypothetical protein
VQQEHNIYLMMDLRKHVQEKSFIRSWKRRTTTAYEPDKKLYGKSFKFMLCL